MHTPIAAVTSHQFQLNVRCNPEGGAKEYKVMDDKEMKRRYPLQYLLRDKSDLFKSAAANDDARRISILYFGSITRGEGGKQEWLKSDIYCLSESVIESTGIIITSSCCLSIY